MLLENVSGVLSMQDVMEYLTKAGSMSDGGAFLASNRVHYLFAECEKAQIDASLGDRHRPYGGSWSEDLRHLHMQEISSLKSTSLT